MTRSGWIRRTWSDTSRGLRWASIVMWAIAVVSTAAGALGDVRGWWTAWPFMTNLASSLSGALFGVPIALIVLEQIAVGETSRRERASLLRFAALTIDGMAAELEGLGRGAGPLHDLAESLRLLTQEMSGTTGWNRRDPRFDQAISSWTSARTVWQDSAIDRVHLQLVIARATSQWRFFRDHLGPQLTLQGVAWTAAPDGGSVGQLLGVVVRDYRCSDDDIGRGPAGPDVDGDIDGTLMAMEEDAETMMASARAVTRLRTAVASLAQTIRDAR